MSTHRFHVADYVVFGVTIIISIGIGVYYAISGGKQQTTAEYLVGGRAMGVLPVAISLLVSFESSIMMLGLPAEAYVYGVQWIWWAAGGFVSQMLSIHVVVPLLHPLNLTSAYEYLELRFNSKAVRLLGSVLGMLSYIWYLGIVLYGPAVALEAVTGFSLWSSIFLISGVSVIYTAIGGLKAVIWTDVFQALVMFMGLFSILIKGTIDSGGPSLTWSIAEEGGRMNFFNFSMDLRERHTFWNLFAGSIIRGFGMIFNQSSVQRISSTPSQREAKRMLILVAPSFFISLALAMYTGIVAYSYYQTIQCDPLESGQIENPNQIIPFLVMDIFASLPGMPGLFLAALFSASLSTLSSGLSSLSALLWADFVHPVVGDITEAKATIIAKASVVFFGLSSCAIAVAVAQIGGTLIQIAGSLLSAFISPLSGIFFLACFFPSSTAKGALCGGVLSFVLSLWIAMGMSFSPSMKKTPWLPPASTDRCLNMANMTNSTWWSGGWNDSSSLDLARALNWGINSTTTVAQQPAVDLSPQGVEVIYTLSYQWLSVLGIFVTIIVGIFASLFTGMNKPGDVDPRYLISFIDTFLICLPGRVRHFLSSHGTQFQSQEFKEKFARKDQELTVVVKENASKTTLHKHHIPKRENKDVSKQQNKNAISQQNKDIPPYPHKDAPTHPHKDDIHSDGNWQISVITNGSMMDQNNHTQLTLNTNMSGHV